MRLNPPETCAAAAAAKVNLLSRLLFYSEQLESGRPPPISPLVLLGSISGSCRVSGREESRGGGPEVRNFDNKSEK